MTYSEATYEVLEPGIYSAVLKTIGSGTGEYGEYLRFEWSALDEDGHETETEISALCNPILNSRSKLSAWASAHLNRTLTVGEEVDLDECVGKKVMLTLTVEPRKDGQGDRNRVAAVSPLRRKPAAAAAKPKAEATEDTEEVPF
jgi:hypothetical protein